MRKTSFLLFQILLLGFLLRIFLLTEIPQGFFTDEADIGLTAYHILKTGKDQENHYLPLVVIPGVNGGRNPISVYLTVPFIALFGLNEFSVRFTSSLIGLLSILLMYMISSTIFKKRIALFATFLFALSPWLITFNRIGWEQSSWVLFTLLMIYFLFKEKFFLFILFAGLTLYTYHPSWLVTPLFVLTSILIRVFDKRPPLRMIILFPVFVLLASPLIMAILDGSALGRAKQVFGDSFKIDTRKVLENYFAHFEYTFLYEKGDIDYPGNQITRHSVRGMGQIYLFQLPLVLVGIYTFIKRRTWRDKTILVFLLLYPLSDAIAGTVSATRSLIGIIPLTLLSAAGFETLWYKYVNRYNYIIWSKSITFIVLLFFVTYLYAYFILYPTYSSDFWGWQYGPGDIIKYYMSVEKKYDELYLQADANAPHVFLPFYTIDYTLGCKNCSLCFK